MRFFVLFFYAAMSLNRVRSHSLPARTPSLQEAFDSYTSNRQLHSRFLWASMVDGKMSRKMSAEKVTSNGVWSHYTPHQNSSICSGNGQKAAECRKISSFQVALVYMRSVHNLLEYDTRLLDRLQESCWEYLGGMFADIAVFCSPSLFR